jgi:heptosyltransferase-3
MERLACLIVARYLGDAVIQGNFLRRLVERGYAQRYIVWTRPQMAFFFEGITGCVVVCSQFPIATIKQFRMRATLDFLRAAREIRGQHPSVSIDLIGDVRERAFAKLAGSRRHIHIGWAFDHPFNRLIRNPFGRGKPAVIVPTATLNIYDAYYLMLEHLIPSAPRNPSRSIVSAKNRLRQNGKNRPRIGLHPLASQRSKLWPFERWAILASEFLRMGVDVAVFGAPGERAQLESIFAQVVNQISIVTETLQGMARAVEAIDVAVGLDSFFVHHAASVGTRSIVLMGGNHPAIWAPPNADVLSGSGGCIYYPCYNKPKCLGSKTEFACIKSISVETVLAAVKSALAQPSYS